MSFYEQLVFTLTQFFHVCQLRFVPVWNKLNLSVIPSIFTVCSIPKLLFVSLSNHTFVRGNHFIFILFLEILTDFNFFYEQRVYQFSWNYNTMTLTFWISKLRIQAIFTACVRIIFVAIAIPICRFSWTNLNTSFYISGHFACFTFLFLYNLHFIAPIICNHGKFSLEKTQLFVLKFIQTTEIDFSCCNTRLKRN